MQVKNTVLGLLALWWVVVIFSVCFANERESMAVGSVTLVIGQSYAINKEGQKRRLHRTDAVFVGDEIKTDSSSHVHIRFIDDGRVSVRPDSRLHIESYRYDKQAPENSAIRFYLQYGVLRSISGKATEAAHHRYRMNTPIAALGVLGTDYIVRTNSEVTWAAVYSGAIALAPIDKGCDSLGLGVCANALKLTADMGNKYLEVKVGDERTRLKTQIDTYKVDPPDSEDKNTVGGDQKNNSGNNENNSTVDSKADINKGLTDTPIKDQKNDLASNEKLGIDDNVARASPFVWARWPWQDKRPDDKLTKGRDELQGEAKITVGNSYAGLFRMPNALQELQPQSGVFNFDLQNKHVVFMEKGGAVSPATLDKAKLQIDFGRRQFDTKLEMSNEKVGSAAINLQGRVANDGIFRANDSTGRVAGALSLDGKEAGMLFERELKNGTFQGITKWQQQ